MEVIKQLEREQMRMDVLDFLPGDTVRVHVKIKEGDKERIQVFQGVVISKRKGGISASFTVRKVSYGVGVERVFPYHSPIIERVERVTRAGCGAPRSTTCANCAARRPASAKSG
jgi:large subunit ribosomal protein L19